MSATQNSPTVADKILTETRQGRLATEKLLPLLALISPDPGGGPDNPAEQMMSILEAILTSLQRVDARTELILAKIGSAKQGVASINAVQEAD